VLLVNRAPSPLADGCNDNSVRKPTDWAGGGRRECAGEIGKTNPMGEQASENQMVEGRGRAKRSPPGGVQVLGWRLFANRTGPWNVQIASPLLAYNDIRLPKRVPYL